MCILGVKPFFFYAVEDLTGGMDRLPISTEYPQGATAGVPMYLMKFKLRAIKSLLYIGL